MSTFHDRVKLARTTLAAMRQRVGPRGQVSPSAADSAVGVAQPTTVQGEGGADS